MAIRKGDVDTLNVLDNWIEVNTKFFQQRQHYWFETQDWRAQLGQDQLSAIGHRLPIAPAGCRRRAGDRCWARLLDVAVIAGVLGGLAWLA